MLETAGFHTGMTFQEAMARLKAYRPALEIKTQQRQIPELGPGYMVSMIYASTPSSNTPNADAERINLSISYLPNTPSVLGIDRDVIYSDKSAPTIVDTVAALRAKYGREMLGFGSRQIYWGWDEAGRPIGEVQMRACGAFVGLSYMMNEESEINRPAPIPSNAHVCAKSHLIMANIVPADNPALVHALSIMMTDVGLGIDSMTRSRESMLRSICLIDLNAP